MFHSKIQREAKHTVQLSAQYMRHLKTFALRESALPAGGHYGGEAEAAHHRAGAERQRLWGALPTV